MLRLHTLSLCSCRPRAQRLTGAPQSSFSGAEHASTVEALRILSVDVSKVRKLKGWVLNHHPVYVTETVSMLKDLGADGSVIARVLNIHPEAIICTPEHMEMQKALWMSVCATPKDLVGIIEKFPASFFTSHGHIDHQRANVDFFQDLGLNKRVVAKLMASAPQSFSRPLKQNQEMVRTLSQTFLEQGGSEVNMKVWLQKLLSQNPYVLQKSPEAMGRNVNFLQQRGFTRPELLQLMSSLKGFVMEVQPESMALSLKFSQEVLGCNESDLRKMVLTCPALLYHPVPILEDRFQCLLRAGVTVQQIIQTPTVLELTTQIIQYRIQKLRSYGYDVTTGSLEMLNGTKKDFEKSCGTLNLRQERPLFNPVAPLRADE